MQVSLKMVEFPSAIDNTESYLNIVVTLSNIELSQLTIHLFILYNYLCFIMFNNQLE